MKRKRGCVKRGLAGLLSAGMLLGSFVVGGPQVEVVAAQTVEELPTAYSSLAEGYMPPVRNQGILGNCWAYAANALVEISLIKNGAVKPDEIDLSESHTVYYVCRPVADPLGGTDGDYTSVLNDTVYTMFNNGAAIGDTASSFLGWIGPVQEKDFYDYDYLLENHNEPTQLEGLNDVEHAYGKRAAIVTETASVNMINTEDVKRAIMDYGGIGIGYNATTSNYDSEHSSQYTPNYMPNNHAVVIVGWDDSFPKENFQRTPDGDGAWLVRNSWGPGRHVGGYFWLSYYDKTISDGARVYRAVAPDKYDNNYRYDRTGNDFGYEDAPEGGFVEAANIFKIQKEQEILKAVQFGMQWKNQNYSIQVYKNPTDPEKPHTGEALLKEPVQGTRNMPGHYTVDLGQSIVLEKDDVIAVSVTFSSDNPDVWPAAQTGNYGVCNVGESMFRVNGGEWQDCGTIGGKNFIIRAFTSNVTEASESHQHEWAENWSTNDYAHWHDCEGSNCCTAEGGNDYEPHSGGTANCRDRAVCEECGQEYGLKNTEIHVGGMIRKNVRPALTFMTGYTGDICCVGCNVVFEHGEEIPMLDKEPEASPVKKVPNLEYTFMSLNGEEVSSKADGKPKIIMFYGAGCGHCVNTLDNITEKTIDGIDICAVEVNQSSGEKIFALKDSLGVAKDNIDFCYDSETTEASQARIAYEQAFNGMTYSSLPVLCYIDENNQISQITSGEQTLNQVKNNLALYCGFKTKNLDVANPSNAVFTTLDGEEITFEAEGKPKVLIFFAKGKMTEKTLESISSERIKGVDIYVIDIFSGDGETTRAYIEEHMKKSSDIKVVQNPDAIQEMFHYTDAIKETNNISYPLICYIDADNKLQQVTMGESTLEELRLNLSANCGYQGEPKPDPEPEPEPETAVTDIFVDVEEGQWYVEPIQYVYDKGIIVGDGNIFAPDNATTRAMFVVMLHRMENSPKVTDYTKYDQLTDLCGTREWYSEAIAWALNEGLTTGDTVLNLYNPNAPITREQLALFFWRYAQYKGENVTVNRDADEILGGSYVNDWAKAGFIWAVDSGLIKGSESLGTDGQIQYDLMPQGGATRAQLATVLQRFLEERN